MMKVFYSDLGLAKCQMDATNLNLWKVKAALHGVPLKTRKE